LLSRICLRQFGEFLCLVLRSGEKCELSYLRHKKCRFSVALLTLYVPNVCVCVCVRAFVNIYTCGCFACMHVDIYKLNKYYVSHHGYASNCIFLLERAHACTHTFMCIYHPKPHNDSFHDLKSVLKQCNSRSIIFPCTIFLAIIFKRNCQNYFTIYFSVPILLSHIKTRKLFIILNQQQQ
jgi:hypothetical protein